MLVQTMTTQEIYHEIISDLESVRRKGKIHTDLLWKQMMRKKLHQQVCNITFKTLKLNEWNVIFQLTTEYRKTGFYIKSRDSKGSIAYSVQFAHEGQKNEEIFIIKYTTHFFERYNERMMLGFKEANKIIKYFFRNNFDFEIGQTQQFDDSTRLIHFIFKEGIGIGWKDDDKKILCLKTFISNTTLTKHQHNLVENIKNDIEYSTYVKLYPFQNKF